MNPGDPMRAKVQKWGNSLALRIPKAVAEIVGLTEGREVELVVEDGRLIVKTTRQRKYTLEELLAQVSEENRHDEVDWGPPMGNEVW
jgi:antitoxin MazE